MLKTTDIYGNAYIGVLCAASEDVSLIPPNVPEKVRQEIEWTLGTEVVSLTVGGSSVLGSLVCLNEEGIVVSGTVEPEEMEILKHLKPTAVLTGRYNAAGNNVLVNDEAALVHPDMGKDDMDLIAETLGVTVRRGTVAGVSTVGSAAVVTRKGIVCHPKITEDERVALEDLFGLQVYTATANYGVPFVGACMVANSRGAVVGSRSTGFELGRIEEGLDLIGK